MGQITIALRAPVAAKPIGRWVEQEVEGLRAAAWSSGVRLGRLWPAWRGQAADWLLEVDLRDRQVDPEDDLLLDSVLMEMKMLGLRPHVLESSPQERSVTADCDAPATHAPARRLS
jgi:hypothetical protein